jgi:hypothetical protein
MTVNCQRQEELNFPVDLVIDAIRVVLAKGGNAFRYDRVVFDEDSKHFSAVIMPWLWPLVLSTKIEIVIIPDRLQTAVAVETCSQKFILGDKYHEYDRYIADFLGCLNQTLRIK